jgi:hypothetical protein
VSNATEAFTFTALDSETFLKVKDKRLKINIKIEINDFFFLGQYHCVNCTVCSECGAKSPEGHFNPALNQQQRQDLAMIAQWNHEFVTNPLTKIQEHRASLCLPCFRKINHKNNDE